MARGAIAQIRKLVYEYLRINTDGSYGTYLSNKRYSSAYVDDEIYSADIEITQLMAKASQDPLLQEIYESASIPIGNPIPVSWVVIKVERSGSKLIELTEDEYDTIAFGGIFDTTTYNNYYKVSDGRIYVLAGTTIEVTYINIDRDSSIKTPSGFESAVAFLAGARCLMNRNDNPTQSQFLLEQYKMFMAGYGIAVDVPYPETNKQQLIED